MKGVVGEVESGAEEEEGDREIGPCLVGLAASHGRLERGEEEDAADDRADEDGGCGVVGCG